MELDGRSGEEFYEEVREGYSSGETDTGGKHRVIEITPEVWATINRVVEERKREEERQGEILKRLDPRCPGCPFSPRRGIKPFLFQNPLDNLRVGA